MWKKEKVGLVHRIGCGHAKHWSEDPSRLQEIDLPKHLLGQIFFNNIVWHLGELG